MAALVPFRALRPVPEAAALVASVPYDVVNAEEARALAAGNPLSFLRVSRAEIELPEDLSPYSDEVYAQAARNLNRLIAEAPLLVEERPGLYVYRLRMGGHVQTGIAGCFSLDEYERDQIRKHEKTRPDKEDDRTRHILGLRAQTGPAFLIYRASPAVNRVADREMAAQSPLFDFTAADEVRHTVWRVGLSSERELIAAFEQVPALYIADGHHRAAAAARARRSLRGPSGAPGAWDTFLAVAFPDSQAQVLPYNRVVKDLGGHSHDSLLAALRARFPLKDGSGNPVRRGDVGMFIDGRWHTIVLGEPPGSAAPADRLDVNRLQQSVLAPLLGIADPRSDARIEFVGGDRGAAELEGRVTAGKAALAFALYPVRVGDLMEIADDGGIMPPKSTWFEPKLRDGLLSHVF